jgi:uncharacterized protein YrrD
MIMLQSAKRLQGFAIAATDGEIGKISDAYFDDEKWTLRNFVVDTGGWLSRHEVLILPMSIRGLDWSAHTARVDLSQQQIENSPGIDTARPVSRQLEAELFLHYDYPLYWTGPLLWGFGAMPPLGGMIDSTQTTDPVGATKHDDEANLANAHLRSCDEVIGYHIRATDGTFGHVEDFLFDDEDWSIRFIAVNTSNWLAGKHVLISPQLITRVNWAENNVFVNVSRETIESSPEFDSSRLPARDSEGGVYRHSGVPPKE